MSKLKSDISDNKRLKANNLRKIVNGITDYTNDVIGLQLVDFQMPDTNRAAEGNIQDVGRIIQVQVKYHFTRGRDSMIVQSKIKIGYNELSGTSKTLVIILICYNHEGSCCRVKVWY